MHIIAEIATTLFLIISAVFNLLTGGSSSPDTSSNLSSGLDDMSSGYATNHAIGSSADQVFDLVQAGAVPASASRMTDRDEIIKVLRAGLVASQDVRVKGYDIDPTVPGTWKDADLSLDGYDSCNELYGDIKISDDGVITSPGFGKTEKACSLRADGEVWSVFGHLPLHMFHDADQRDTYWIGTRSNALVFTTN